MLELSLNKRVSLFVMYISTIIFVGVLVSGMVEKSSDLKTVLIGYFLDLLLTIGVIIFFKKNNIVVLKIDAIKKSEVLRAIMLAIVIFVFIYICGNLFKENASMIFKYKSLNIPILLILLLKVLVSPFIEGIFYRYIVLNISNKHRVILLIASVVIYSILNEVGVVGILFTLCYGVIYLVYGSLELSILVNIIINILIFIFL